MAASGSGQAAPPRRRQPTFSSWPRRSSARRRASIRRLPPGAAYAPLGGVKPHGHKIVYVWAVEGDCDADAIVSNQFEMEWPPRSGRTARFPEVDRAAWFDLPTAREKILPAQRRFLDDLAGRGAAEPPAPSDAPHPSHRFDAPCAVGYTSAAI